MPLLLGERVNSESFQTYVEKILVPTLQKGEIVFHGQSHLPQEKGPSKDHPIGRGEAHLATQIFTGPKPDRVAQTHCAPSSLSLPASVSCSGRHRNVPITSTTRGLQTNLNHPALGQGAGFS
jgi:hypothetical protein